MLHVLFYISKKYIPLKINDRDTTAVLIDCIIIHAVAKLKKNRARLVPNNSEIHFEQQICTEYKQTGYLTVRIIHDIVLVIIFNHAKSSTKVMRKVTRWVENKNPNSSHEKNGIFNF